MARGHSSSVFHMFIVLLLLLSLAHAIARMPIPQRIKDSNDCVRRQLQEEARNVSWKIKASPWKPRYLNWKQAWVGMIDPLVFTN